MHPVLFRIPLPGGGYFDVASYGVMLALGTLAGVFVALRLARRDGVSGDNVVDLGFWSVLAGVLGAKVWFIAQNWNAFPDKMDLLRNFRSGLVFYGGLAGASLAAFIYMRRHRLPVLKVFDVLAPTAMLGLAFGRTGCLLNGCCYGKPTDWAWGIQFPRIVQGDEIVGSPAFLDQFYSRVSGITAASTASTPLAPVQPFEAIGALVIFAILLLARRKRKAYGETTALLFVLYPLLRFTTEFMRGDNERVLVGLTIPQLASLAVLAVAAAALVRLRTATPEALATAPQQPAKRERRAKAR